MARLTFDMSGGPKGAKRPLERPLDGGVRPPQSWGRRVGAHGSRPVCEWGAVPSCIRPRQAMWRCRISAVTTRRRRTAVDRQPSDPRRDRLPDRRWQVQPNATAPTAAAPSDKPANCKCPGCTYARRARVAVTIVLRRCMQVGSTTSSARSKRVARNSTAAATSRRSEGPNVRHERRAKGREAAFGTSARWRG